MNSNLPVSWKRRSASFPANRKPFDLVGRVQRVALLLVERVGIALQHAADVARVERPVLVDDGAEHQHLAVAEHVRRHPVERAPVDVQPQVALFLRREPANRRAVERQVLVGPQQKLLVVIQQVQPAFQVGEQHRDCLDPFFVRKVLQTLLADLIRRHAIQAVGFRLQIELFQLAVRESQKIAVLSGH